MCCCILVCAHYWPRNGRNNVLIGLPDLVKERKLSKIVQIEDYQNIYYYISREIPIQKVHISPYYSDGEYGHSFVIAACDSACLMCNADARTVRSRQETFNIRHDLATFHSQ